MLNGVFRSAVMLMIWLSLSASSRPNPHAEAKQADSQSAIADSVSDIATTYREQTKRSEAQKDTEPCEAGDDRRYSDLCAQWKSADAAAEAAQWAGFGAVASIISLVGIIAALLISIWSNLIIRRTAKHELRAYLGVKSVVAAPDGSGHLSAKIILQNFGSTPAQEVTARIAGCVGDFPSSVLDGNHPEPENQICPGSLHPGAEFDLYASADIIDQSALFEGHHGFYVYGRVNYTDFDGDQHTTNFCYRGTESTLMNKGEMRVSFEGNDAT